jgi:16S rRNA (cytosine1402-N4)-methyltransferase
MLPSVLPTESDHIPVLAEEIVSLLDPRPGDTVVDGTFGAGGHATLLAARLRGDGKLIAIDRDPTVAPFFDRFRRETGVKARLHPGEFSTVLQHLAENGVKADVILLDLGVSSMQLDRPDRGFSYAVDAPLDMRMDPNATYSARELVNEGDERELADIFKRYGEERYARPIARAIVKRRKSQPFERTGDLVEVIKAAIPAPARFGEGHPAKRVFQALRIEVNDELGAIERALPAALEMLRPGGRLAVISFHSLEDRIVKQFLRKQEQGCTCPPDFPICICGSEPLARSVDDRRAGRSSASTDETEDEDAQALASPRTWRNPLDRGKRDSARGRRIRERGSAQAQPLPRFHELRAHPVAGGERCAAVEPVARARVLADSDSCGEGARADLVRPVDVRIRESRQIGRRR